MTKKDFQLIADAFNAEYNRCLKTSGDDDRSPKRVVEDLAQLFGEALQNTNDRFDRERFIAACLEVK